MGAKWLKSGRSTLLYTNSTPRRFYCFLICDKPLTWKLDDLQFALLNVWRMKNPSPISTLRYSSTDKNHHVIFMPRRTQSLSYSHLTIIFACLSFRIRCPPKPPPQNRTRFQWIECLFNALVSKRTGLTNPESWVWIPPEHDFRPQINLSICQIVNTL